MFANNLTAEAWLIFCQLAPWVLLGALLSGMLHAILPPQFVRRQFRGASGVFQAVLLGVPLPLCSCGVIPAGIGLKKQGASDGSAVGFLISTPQTGVDSILVSAALLGWPFAIFKMVTAAVTGVIGGLITDRFVRETNSLPVVQADSGRSNRWREGAEHAIEIVRSIWVWLVIGVVVSAAITVLVPDSFIQTISGWGPVAGVLLALLIALPLYVCATASVPIAAALISAGMQPGAALVFLMAGPATNIATITSVASQFGKKVTAIYLATVILGSVGFALLFDQLFSITVGDDIHAHQHQPNLLETVSAGLLLLMFVWFAVAKIRRRRTSSTEPADDSCCH